LKTSAHDVWRICRAPFARFDGEGARRVGGRWNHPGTAVVYTSGTLSLACLELFVHLGPAEMGLDFVSVRAQVPVGLTVETIEKSALPRGWDRFPPERKAADLGTEWALRGSSAVLRVPSAIIHDEWNYLLNPVHRDFAKITIGRPAPFCFDPRLTQAGR